MELQSCGRHLKSEINNEVRGQASDSIFEEDGDDSDNSEKMFSMVFRHSLLTDFDSFENILSKSQHIL